MHWGDRLPIWVKMWIVYSSRSKVSSYRWTIFVATALEFCFNLYLNWQLIRRRRCGLSTRLVDATLAIRYNILSHQCLVVFSDIKQFHWDSYRKLSGTSAICFVHYTVWLVVNVFLFTHLLLFFSSRGIRFCHLIHDKRSWNHKLTEWVTVRINSVTLQCFDLSS